MFEERFVPPDGGDAELGATLAGLAEQEPPGPTAVAILAGIDPATLTGAQLVDLLKASDRQMAWMAAYQTRVLAAMDHPTDAAQPGRDRAGLPELVPGPGDEQWTELEIAAALRLSPGAAHHRLTVARELAGRLPVTLAALTAGNIGYFHALTVADTTAPLTAQQTLAIEARIHPKAAGQSVGQLRRSLGRAVIAADPAAAHTAHQQAAAQRTVDMWALPDGMAHLQMVGPAPQVSAVYTALTALADRPTRPDDHRLAGARRFDSLYEICAHLLAGGDWPTGTPLPARHGRRPHIQVTVAATTLLGLDQQPAELAGYGPITAEVARRVAADGTWRRILHDPADGRLLDYGRSRYEPPADLQARVIARDQTCRFPHCARPAWRCDIDHAVPWDQGGTTDPDNCHPLCRRHHRAKTHAGWHVHRTPDHTTTWTSPTGHTYTVHPPPYGGDPPGGGSDPPRQEADDGSLPGTDGEDHPPQPEDDDP